MQVVKNLNTLKAMQKQGFIRFCDQTGQKITGLYSNKKFTCYYIDEVTTRRREFIYKGKKYKQQFFSGCFYPYVVELD